MAGVSDESRNDKSFSQAVKQYGLAFSPKSEQLDVIYAVVTGKDVFVKTATGFGNLPFCMCAITSTGLKWRVFRIPVSSP